MVEVVIDVADGQYLLMGDDADLNPQTNEFVFFADRAVLHSRGIAYLQVLGAEETEFVRLGIEYFATKPTVSYPKAKAAWQTFDMFQIYSPTRLEIRTTEQVPIVTVTPVGGHFRAILLRNPATNDATESHKLMIWPNTRWRHGTESVQAPATPSRIGDG